MTGYTSGLAERLYNQFKDGTYLDVETYPAGTTREQAVKLFDDEYGMIEPDAELAQWLDGSLYYYYPTGDDYQVELIERDGRYVVTQTPANFVASLAESYTYQLKEGTDLENGYGLDASDFEYIHWGVAGEHAGDISVWFDPINLTVGGDDFEPHSVAPYTGDIDDQLSYQVSDMAYAIYKGNPW